MPDPTDQLRADLEAAVSQAIGSAALNLPATTDWVNGFAAGARMVWVVDPKRKSVTTYRTLLSPRRLERNDALDGEDVLPGLMIPLEAIF